MDRRTGVIGVLILVTASCAQPKSLPSNTPESVRVPRLTLVRSMPGGPWEQYRVHGQTREVDLFLAHDEKPKPVVVMFQGSACSPLFVIHEDGRFTDTSIFQDSVVRHLDRYHFAHIEKQGVGPLQFQDGMSPEQKGAAFEQTARKCSNGYFKQATKDVRVQDGVDVINTIAAQSWAQRIVLVGHSEGSHVVTGIVRRLSRGPVTAAGLMSSAGPTQFYSFYLSQAGNRQAFATIFERMRTLRTADDDEMYEGLPARRWKSYALESTPLEDVKDSTVPLYVAHGGRENNVLAADLFILEALRQQPNRPLRYVLVRDGDHAFGNGNGHNRFDAVFDDFLQWAVAPGRVTGVTEMK